ncbi:hypothetical protein [Sphingomonas sp. NFR15]|nr:hypothetical protein [Sphingomonas sp. NFR15]
MLAAPDADTFQAIAIEEGLFTRIESVRLVSAETLPDPDQRVML